jgi:hypothetical protein
MRSGRSSAELEKRPHLLDDELTIGTDLPLHPNVYVPEPLDTSGWLELSVKYTSEA